MEALNRAFGGISMRIFSVQTLTQAIKDVLEGEFPFVWVRGQISNFSRPPSGHVYFSLKDGEATLSVVWFKGAQHRLSPANGDERVNALTGEVESCAVLELADDLEVLVAGRINVYPPRGTYQLVAELVQTQGLGELAVAFEIMKARLAAKGYFDSDRKLTVPRNPHRVAVITAPQGAALQDFLRIAGERGLGAQVRVYPTVVQGDGAAVRIAAALHQADQEAWAEVIVLIRGGGSLEDLWAFNTEPVAEALFQTRLPVVCGVGHEVDTTIADLVADLRVATPSHAAQILWTERAVLGQQADELFLALMRSMARFVDRRENAAHRELQTLLRHSPARRLEGLAFDLERMQGRLQQTMQRVLDGRVHGLRRLHDGLHHVFGPARLNDLQNALHDSRQALDLAGRECIRRHQDALRGLDGRLATLDPQAPLTRGYALIRDKRGRAVCSRLDVQPGEIIAVQVSDGLFAAEVQA